MSAPQLSGDGAELLANVLKRREADRHDTLSANRNARRRESDALRQDPPVSNDDRSTKLKPFDGQFSVAREADEPNNEDEQIHVERDVIEVDDIDTDEDLIEVDADEVKSQLVKFLLGVGVTIAVVICVALAVTLENRPASVDTAVVEQPVETVEEQVVVEAEVAGEVEVSEDATPVDEIEPVAVDDADDSQIVDDLEIADEVVVAGPEANDVAPSEPIGSDRAAADFFEVTVYDAAPAQGDVHSFALRIENIAAGEEVPTEELEVFVGNEEGAVATTFIRFLHESVPEGTSALASVRAEDAGPGTQFVFVLLDGVELARIPVE